jgi:predicted amidohydrolase
MQNLKVTLVQANQAWENPEANYRNYSNLLSGLETDLIVLPEMFQTCFTMNRTWAESFESSSGLQWLKGLAKEKNAAVYTSLMTEYHGKYYNRGVFVEPEGTVHTYDKRKTFGLANEDAFFDAGTEPTVVSYKGWKLQLQICYDLRFPEISRNNYSNQYAAYDVLLYVANWPEKRSAHWRALLVARAIENQCYVVGVNRVGTDGNGFNYSGDSGVINPLGETHFLEPEKEQVKTIVMNYDEMNQIREKLPFLRDAR